jgi:hypothetical protein
MTLSRRLVSDQPNHAQQVVVRLFSIVTMPILTTLLSPQAYGTAALVVR